MASYAVLLQHCATESHFADEPPVGTSTEEDLLGVELGNPATSLLRDARMFSYVLAIA
jgi:hypothetical protein